jgi:hypothetical protein
VYVKKKKGERQVRGSQLPRTETFKPGVHKRDLRRKNRKSVISPARNKELTKSRNSQAEPDFSVSKTS